MTGRFRVATRKEFDVNPVTWHVLAHHGVAFRGPDRERLQIRTDEAELRAWALANLNDYWQRWVECARLRLVRSRGSALPVLKGSRPRSSYQHDRSATAER